MCDNSKDSYILTPEKICRICLKSKDNMLNIFLPNDDTYKEKIKNKIMLCANVQIDENDGLPSNICVNCLENLNIAFEFRILCHSSEATLKSMLNPKADRDEHIVKQEYISIDAIEVKKEPNEDDTKMALNPFYEGSRQDSVTEYFSNKKERFKEKLKMNRKGRRKKGEISSTKQLTCGICLRVFNCKMDLYLHEKTQKHFAKFPCLICGKIYSRNYIMVHLASHNTERLYQCKICFREYSHKYELSAHVKRVHNEGEKLECSTCGQAYSRRYDLVVHLRKHTNERPFICETCGKAFFRKDKLTKHRMIHDGVKNFMCDICGRKFRQQPHLKEHIHTHMGIKPYQCDLCKSAFTQKHCLKTHYLIKHQKNCLV